MPARQATRGGRGRAPLCYDGYISRPFENGTTMWNYSFVVPSLLIMLTLLGFYFSRPRLPIRINRTFLALLVTQLLVVATDVGSSLADEAYERFAPGWLYAFNTAFFVFFLARILCFYLFALDASHVYADLTDPLFVASLLPFVVGEVLCVSSFATGAVFSITGSGYVSGPAYNVLYVCFYCYITLSLMVVARHGARLTRHELIGVAAYNLVLLAGCVVRVLFPRMLVMNTFCTVAIVIIYLEFLNPDLYLSERGPAFNMRGFRTLMAQPSKQPDLHVLGFAIRNYAQERSILGGEQADAAITQVNEYLHRTCRTCATFYLRGGRFAVVGHDANDYEQAIRRRFEHPWAAGDGEVFVDIAFASVDARSNPQTADRVVNNITIALDNARNSPTSVVETQGLRPLSVQEIDQQVDILGLLERSIEDGEVEVFFQPLVESGSHALVAAEALARLRDERGDLVSPMLFIPIAEKSGYINQLGRQVFEKACAFVRDHDLASLGLSWINVNLSPVQCLQPGLAESFDAILRDYGVSPERIHLEITEQSMVDYSLLQQQVQALQSDGFQFVLDDYGSGYSNLTRVKHYPFVNIKLDTEVVWDYFRDRDSLLPTIVRGFKDMGLTITAEGIETQEMAQVLTDIGSDYLQGFLFSRPLPPDEFVDYALHAT